MHGRKALFILEGYGLIYDLYISVWIQEGCMVRRVYSDVGGCVHVPFVDQLTLCDTGGESPSQTQTLGAQRRIVCKYHWILYNPFQGMWNSYAQLVRPGRLH